MSLPLVLSETAIDTFDALSVQIKQRLGEESDKRFRKNTVKVLDFISHNPYLYPVSEYNPNIRRAVINKLSSVFYEIKGNRIEVLFFWDNRQAPMMG